MQMDQEESRAGGRRRGDRISSAAPRRFRASFCRAFASAGLLALVVGYCFLGAFLFQFLEAELEVEQKKAVERHRDDCIKELWHITEHLNVLYEKNWTLLVNDRLRLFETSVATATLTDGSILMNEQKQWSYGGALFYSVAVITTIGFGNWAPKTSAGKLMTMVYAVMGIPLMILCLAYLGTLIAHAFRLGYAAICCFFFSQCFPKKENVCKSQSALISASQEEAELTVDIEESIEEISIEEHLMEEFKDLHNVQTMSDSYTLPATDINASDAGLSFLRPSTHNVTEHELKHKTLEGNVSSYVKLNVEVQRKSGTQQEEFLSKRNLDKEIMTEQCFPCGEECGQDDHCGCRESSSHEPVTPSRVPLIGKSQTQEYPLTALAEAKHIWTSALSTRPPTPVPNKQGCKTREKLSRYAHSLNYITENDSKKAAEHKVPIFLVLGILSAYICLGGILFATMEDWSFLDGAYFCFITLATIGFEDTGLGKSHQVEHLIKPFKSKVHASLTSTPSSLASFPETDGDMKQQLRLITCSLYLLLGLVLIASSIALVQEEVVAYHQSLQKYLGITQKDSIEEENEELDELHEPLKEMSFS